MNSPSKRTEKVAIVATIVCGAITTAVSVGGSWLIWASQDQLPTEVATHWGPNGKADAFKAVADLPLENLVICLVIPLFLLALGPITKQARTIGPIAAATSVFMSVVINGSILAQRGMTPEQVRAESDASLALVIAGVVSLATGLGLWAIFRRRPSDAAVAVDLAETSPRLLVDDGVTLAWTGRTRISRAAQLILWGSGLLTLAIGVWMLVAGSWGGAATVLGTAALLAVIGAAMVTNVVVDERGVRAKALGLFNVVNVPLSTISAASVKPNVNPLGDYGGWGLRVGFNGEMGLVTSSGPGLKLERGQTQGPFVITLADAEAAAATVNTLLARRAGHLES